MAQPRNRARKVRTGSSQLVLAAVLVLAVSFVAHLAGWSFAASQAPLFTDTPALSAADEEARALLDALLGGRPTAFDI